MGIAITKRDIIWGYVGYFFRTAANLILLPFIVRFLSPKELGLWYAFISLGGMVSLLDFGFLPTILRNISYSWSGAAELLRAGVTATVISEGPNYKLLKRVIIASKKIYLLISAVALILLLTAGTWYIRSISALLDQQTVLIAWGIYCVGIFLNLYYSYWSPFLTGIGAIKENQTCIVFARGMQLVVAIIGLFLHYGLIAISVSYMVSGIVLQQASRFFFYRETRIKENLAASNEARSEDEFVGMFRTIWHNAWRSGVVSVGAFLITQSNTLICSSFYGLEMTAQYGLSLQVFGIIGALSGVIFNSYLPVLHEASLNSDRSRAKRIISIAACISWISYIAASLLAVLFGETILGLIGSRSHLLSPSMLLLVMTYLFLEANHSMFAAVITTENIVPFVPAAILSGIAIVLCSLLLAKFTTYGVIGLLLSQALIQLAYNNWRWPLWVKRRYDLHLREMFGEFFLVLKAKIREAIQ